MAAGFERDPEFHETPPKPSPARGFRLVEFLTVLAILAVLIALALPLKRSSRGAAHRAQCTNNLKQIALALFNYEQIYSAMPPAYTVGVGGRPLHSWRTLILPYLEQESLYRTIDLSRPWDDPANAKARESFVSVYHCPGAAGPPNTTTYLAIVAPDGFLRPQVPRRLAEITDAHESTLMVIEAGEENAVPWMAPRDAGESLVLSLGPATKLHHVGGMNAGLVNGSVRFLRAVTPARVRRALMTISGNEVLAGGEF